MAITIPCPRCRASLKAKKAPPSDKLLQCLKCGHWFTLSEVAIAPIAHPIARPKAESFVAGPLFRTGVIAVALLAGVVGIAAYLLNRPSATTQPGPIAEKKEAPQETPSEAKKASVPDTVPVDPILSKKDGEQEKRRQFFTQLMIEGGIAQQLKNYDVAHTAYSEAIKIFPDDADVRRKLGEVQAAQEVALKARQELEKLQSEVSALVKHGNEALERKQVQAAINFYKLALQKDGANVEAAQKMVKTQELLQREEERKQTLARFDLHLLAGQAALKAGRPLDAIRELGAANKILPDDPFLPGLLKEAEKKLAEMRNGEDGKKNLQRLIDQARDMARQKKWDAAEQAYRQALKLSPNDPALLKGLSETQKEIQGARGEVVQVVNQANNLIRLGRIGEAVAVLRDGNNSHPQNADLQRALQIAELIQQHQTAYYQAMNQAANAMSLRQYGNAVLAYNEALRLVPNDPIALAGLIEAQRALEVMARIKLEYDRLVNIGLAQLRMQSYAQGSVTFNQALRLMQPPLVPDPQLLRLIRYADSMNAGIAALNAGQNLVAAQQFQLALLEVPGDPTAVSLLQRARLGKRP